MPRIAVTELIGRVPLYVGSCEIISLIKTNIAPMIADAGIRILWSAVLNSIRAMCGTIIPTKPIGPQNAVIEPARIPVLVKIKILVIDKFKPELFA